MHSSIERLFDHPAGAMDQPAEGLQPDKADGGPAWDVFQHLQAGI